MSAERLGWGAELEEEQKGEERGKAFGAWWRKERSPRRFRFERSHWQPLGCEKVAIQSKDAEFLVQHA